MSNNLPTILFVANPFDMSGQFDRMISSVSRISAAIALMAIERAREDATNYEFFEDLDEYVEQETKAPAIFVRGSRRLTKAQKISLENEIIEAIKAHTWKLTQLEIWFWRLARQEFTMVPTYFLELVKTLARRCEKMGKVLFQYFTLLDLEAKRRILKHSGNLCDHLDNLHKAWRDAAPENREYKGCTCFWEQHLMKALPGDGDVPEMVACSRRHCDWEASGFEEVREILDELLVNTSKKSCWGFDLKPKLARILARSREEQEARGY
ncbi:hypothetical protein TWF696_007904 [Orbilia brochopaga]|uniref:Uncharacterized protein n=1 Tax=Orbilia brochopaga TaxID=3140254 RepID=A0AAV9ULM5_9PEZI